MKTVWLDRDDNGGFRVAWTQGAQPVKHKVFTDRKEAESFAYKKMGRTGCVVSSLDMTADQLADLKARRGRAAAMLASL